MAEVKHVGTLNDPKKYRAVFGRVEELAEYLGIGRQAAYQALRRGQVPCLRLGRRFIIPRAAVEEWLRRAGELRQIPQAHSLDGTTQQQRDGNERQ